VIERAGFCSLEEAETMARWVDFVAIRLCGDERFKRQIAKMAGRRATPLLRGRPAADGTDKRQLNLL
jgi:hypothetical protein